MSCIRQHLRQHFRKRLRHRVGDDRGAVTIFAIGAIAASMLLLGLVLDGGIMLRARSDAFSVAAAAARAGAQQLNHDAAVQGTTVLDPHTAEQAALDYLTARGATGTVTVTAETITVTVTTTAHLQLLKLAGADTATFSAVSTVNLIKVAGG